MPDIVVEEGKIELAPKEGELIEKPQDVFGQFEKGDLKKEEKQDYKSDNQLMRCVDVLKALKIYKGIKK